MNLIGVVKPHEIFKDCCKGVRYLGWYQNLVNLRSVDIRMMINAGIYSNRHLYKTDKTKVKLNEDKEVPVDQCVLSECVCTSDSASSFFQTDSMPACLLGSLKLSSLNRDCWDILNSILRT